MRVLVTNFVCFACFLVSGFSSLYAQGDSIFASAFARQLLAGPEDALGGLEDGLAGPEAALAGTKDGLAGPKDVIAGPKDGESVDADLSYANSPDLVQIMDRPYNQPLRTSWETALALAAQVEELPPSNDLSSVAESAPASGSSMSQLMRLKKPIAEVRIRATDEGQRVPDDRAESYASEEPPLLVGALGMTAPLPNRYTIGFKHRPLYFEQPTLERCGGAFGYLQTPVSAAQFLVHTVLLPYHMCATPFHCPVPAGGDCMACQVYPVDCNPFPLDYRAFSAEAAALAGFSFLLL